MRTLLCFLLIGCAACSTPVARSNAELLPFEAYYPLEKVGRSYQIPSAFEKAVGNEKEWKALWRQIEIHSSLEDEASPLSEEPPTIDFRRHTLLVVASGSRTSGGFSVGFHSVREYEHHIDVTAYELRPFGNECLVTTSETYPVAFALIPRTQKPIRFRLERADLTCES